MQSEDLINVLPGLLNRYATNHGFARLLKLFKASNAKIQDIRVLVFGRHNLCRRNVLSFAVRFPRSCALSRGGNTVVLSKHTFDKLETANTLFWDAFFLATSQVAKTMRAIAVLFI